MELGLFLMPASQAERPLAETIDWNLDMIGRADTLDYSEAWIGQHITSPWEPLVSPQQIIAGALGRTERIRLGTGVEVLYQQHPVRLAAELAQLDHMAKGRLMFGFGAGGTLTDGQLYGLDLRSGQSQKMSQEALRIILDCWKDGGPDDFDGEYWTVRRPENYSESYYWHLTPYAPAEPRIGFAGFMPNSGSLMTAGEHGYIPLSFNVAPEHVAVHWSSVEEGAAKSGRKPSRANWRHIREIFVADTKAEARKAVVDGFMGRFWNRYFSVIAQRLGIEDMFRRANAPGDAPVDAAYLVDHGTWFVGDPDQVAGQIVEQHALTGGFGMLLQIGFDYSDAGARDGWFRSMELLANEVMPRVRSRLGTATPRAVS
ncbi:MAG: LLM class flavin-dependent oxidoreductase [Alphaproteobacteria bacterium]|nr:LLM class flavin-dependent oxidoreductase [Alphaproteobacteria bacterium]